MKEKETHEAADIQAEKKQEPKKTNKSWEGFMKWKGSVIVNDPTLLC